MLFGDGCHQRAPVFIVIRIQAKQVAVDGAIDSSFELRSLGNKETFLRSLFEITPKLMLKAQAFNFLKEVAMIKGIIDSTRLN